MTHNTYTFHREWLPSRTKAQLVRWLAQHTPLQWRREQGLTGSREKQVARHTREWLRQRVKEQVLDLVLVLYDRTFCLTASRHSTSRWLKEQVIGQRWSLRTPHSLADFHLTDGGSMSDWRQRTLYTEELTLDESGLRNNQYVFCVRSISERAQRAIVRERLANHYRNLEEIKQTQITGVDGVVRLGGEAFAEEMRQDCYRPPTPPGVLDCMSCL